MAKRGLTRITAIPTYNSKTNTVTLDPKDNVASATKHRAAITKELKDQSDNALAKNEVCEFTTAEKTGTK